MEDLIAVMRAVGGRNRYSTNLLSGEGGCNDCENIFYKKDFNCTTIPLSSTNCIPFVTIEIDNNWNELVWHLDRRLSSPVQQPLINTVN